METKVEVNARQCSLGAEEALKVVEGVSQVYVAKGKKVIHLDLRKENPTAEELTKLLLGPTGNLRAPTIRRGKTLLVGFHEATYESVLG